MIRDISPAIWVTPGTMNMVLAPTLSANSPDPLPLDQWFSSSSPSIDVTVNLASGWQTLTSLIPSLSTVPTGLSSDTGIRVIVVVMPRGNTVTATLKGVTGDTGIPMNANGFAAVAVPAAATITWGITAGAAISGVRVLVM